MRLPGSGGALASLPYTKIHPKRNQGTDDAKIWRRTWGGQGKDTEAERDPQMANPLGVYRELVAGQGRQRGERAITGNGSRRRHTAQGAGTSGKGRRVAGEVDAQVGGALQRKRRWGAGEKR